MTTSEFKRRVQMLETGTLDRGVFFSAGATTAFLRTLLDRYSGDEAAYIADRVLIRFLRVQGWSDLAAVFERTRIDNQPREQSE